MIYHSACSFGCYIKALVLFFIYFLGEKTEDASLSDATPPTKPVFHHGSSCGRDPAREFLPLLTRVTGGFSVDATFNCFNKQARGAALMDPCEAGLDPRVPS